MTRRAGYNQSTLVATLAMKRLSWYARLTIFCHLRPSCRAAAAPASTTCIHPKEPSLHNRVALAGFVGSLVGNAAGPAQCKTMAAVEKASTMKHRQGYEQLAVLKPFDKRLAAIFLPRCNEGWGCQQQFICFLSGGSAGEHRSNIVERR
jgi:hypothetical protein